MNEQEVHDRSIFCIVAKEDSNNSLYQDFKIQLEGALKDEPIKTDLYESCNILAGSDRLEELHKLSNNATCCVAIISRHFFLDKECEGLLTDAVTKKLLLIKLSASYLSQSGRLRNCSSLPHKGTLTTPDENQNIQFTGSSGARPQPSAFLQVDGADVNLVNCEMTGFHSDAEGSALSNLYGNVRIENSTLESNQSTGDGGAIYNLGLSSLDEGILTLDNSTVSFNQTFYSGGGIYNLGGTLIILHGSYVTSNETRYNDAEVEGGGAIASQDGTVFISTSWISSNRANKDGGGILLIGTNAQILSSTISNNTAPIGNGGGGIDIETNHENSQQSHLTLTDTSVQYNTASGPFQNIAGQMLPNGLIPSLMVVTSSAFKAPNPANRPSSLTIEDFSTYCQGHQDKAGDSFVAAAPSADANGQPIIVCVTANQTQTPLAEVENKSTEQAAVQAVCQSTYFRTKNFSSILARLFNYSDLLSWQCFQNERLLGTIATAATKTKPANKIRLDQYCQTTYHSTNFIEATLQNPSSPTAYDWKCIFHSIPYRIQMDVVCQSFFDTQPHPNAISVLPDFGPYSWQCWEPE